jgi:hypothetical protein
MLRIRVEYPSTQRLDAEVLEKFYDDLVPDLPRVPYVEEASARATVEAMQALGRRFRKSISKLVMTMAY